MISKVLSDELKRIQTLSGHSEYPALDITWKPYSDAEYQIRYVDVIMGIESPNVEAGDTLVSLWVNVASIPCSIFTEGGLKASDEQGVLEFNEVIEKDNYGFDIKRWKPARKTVGNVAITYSFYPRVVPYDYKFRPYYDFRTEKYGATGSGVSSLVVPRDIHYQIYINWDLSEMPSDSKAVAVKGEGDFTYVGNPYTYQFTMYAVGKVKSVKSENDRFMIYWLNEPLPDKERVVTGIPKILKGMADFFEDNETHYKVFFRKDPFKMSRGATAFDNGFIYGYSDEKNLDFDIALDIFAHEVVHTWPKIEDKAGEGTWYHEGTAELYSIKIPYRLGITDLDYVAYQINERGMRYYNNKYKTTPNTEAHPLYWSDSDAQGLPYGRGFFYFVDTDMKIRKKTNGKRSVDDLVLEIERRRRSGENVTRENWKEILEKELGNGAVDEFEAICQGKLIEPNEDWFDGAFTISRGKVYDRVRDIEKEGYIWTKKSGVKTANI